MKESRDNELGERLGRLNECPPLKPGFEARVWERIEAEAAQAPVGQARAFGVRHRRPLLVAAGVAIAAIAAAAIVLFGLPGSGSKTGPSPVSAAEISGRMAEAMSSYRTLQGTMTTSGNAAYVDGGTFVTDAAGDFSLRFAAASATRVSKAEKVSQPLVLTYNAHRHVQIDTYVDPGDRRVSYEWDQSLPFEGIGVPGWTYPYPPGYAWLVRAALADGDPRITAEDTVFDGRSAWKVSLPSIPYFGNLRGMSFVVDSRSGFLVQWTTPPDPANPGSGVTSSLTDLRVDQPLPAGAFSVAVPRGAKLVRQERNEYYCTLAQVLARVGFPPFLPSFLPPGYALSDVATDPRMADDFLGWQGPDPGTHPPHTEVFLRYSHGADSFTVHIASVAGISPSEVTGYFRGLTGFPAYESALLRAGSFAGMTAQTWFDINGANLVVMGKAYVVFISGSLTRREMYEVANSLQQS